MATIYEVAKQAGVSLSTVSRVLNGKGSVNPVMAEKVKRAAHELQYAPSHIARALASKYTNAIGIVLPNTNMVFASHLLFSFERILRKHQKHCVVAFSHDTEESENDAIAFLLSQGCDAIVVSTIAPNAQHLNNKSKPVVVLDTTGTDNNKTGVIASFNRVLQRAHAFLVSEGHTEIALLYDDKSIACDDTLSLFSGSMVIQAGSDTTSEPLLDLLALEQTFSAVICSNALLAASVASSAKELGMELPDDLSIMVAHAPNAPAAYSYTPTDRPVSSVEYSTLEIAKSLACKSLSVAYELTENEDATIEPTPIIHDYGTVAPFS